MSHLKISFLVLSVLSMKRKVRLFSSVLRDSAPCFVGLSVRWSVDWSIRWSRFNFSEFLRSLALLLLAAPSSDLKYGP